MLFQRTSSALRKFAQRQRPDGHTHEPAHFYFQRFEHSPDVPVLAFFQHNFEPRITFAMAKNADFFQAQQFAILGADSASQCLHQRFIGNGPNLHVVRLIEMGLRCGNAGRPFRIIRKKQ